MQALEVALKASEAKVSAVSMKLPPFWPDKAVLWFAHAEAQFLLRNITLDKTKFAHVMTMLDSKTTSRTSTTSNTTTSNQGNFRSG